MGSPKSATPMPTAAPTPSMGFFSLTGMKDDGLATIASTPKPTPPPTPDPLDYEKTVFQDRINDHNLSILKEQVRKLKGLPLTTDLTKKKINYVKPPKVYPRPTLTSTRRKELQQHRMLVNCANMKDKYKSYEQSAKKDGVDNAVFRSLRDEAMSKTIEDRDFAFDHEELMNLKELAMRAKENEVKKFKENEGSKFRFRFIRGEPIISSNFRISYADYSRPPFTMVKQFQQPKIYNMPKIDKKKEIWLFPIDDEQGIPLHWQKKFVDSKNKKSAKERTIRSPVKKGKRTTMEEWNKIMERKAQQAEAEKEEKEGKPRQKSKSAKRPWGYYGGCPLNVGSFK